MSSPAPGGPTDRPFSDVGRAFGAGDADAHSVHQAVLQTRFWCEAGDSPGAAALGSSEAAVVAAFTSEAELARARGPVLWFSTTGADLLDLLPGSCELAVDTGAEAPLRLRLAAVRRSTVVGIDWDRTMRLQVDLERLEGVEWALGAAARAAREMSSCGDDPPDRDTAGEVRRLREGVESFVEGWSLGMKLVADDADRFASLLHAAAGPSLEGTSHPPAASVSGPGPHDTLRITISDEADRVEILATWLAACGQQASRGADRLRRVDVEAWTGEGADAFGQAIAALCSRLDEGALAFRESAATLRACAAVLWEAALRAKQAGVVPASLYGGNRGPGEGPQPEGGKAPELFALEELESSKASVETAVQRAVGRLRLAADLAPRGPGSPGPLPDTAGGAGPAAWSSVWGRGLFTFQVTQVHELIDPQAYVEAVPSLADELVDRETHPVAFRGGPGGAAGWDMWLNHPARALGQIVPPRPEPPAAGEAAVDAISESISREQTPDAVVGIDVDAEEAPDAVDVADVVAEETADPVGAPEEAPEVVGAAEMHPEEALPGTLGRSSGRPFDPASAGGTLRHLNGSRIRVTPRAAAVVDRHVSRFGPDEVDAAMVTRLRRIAAGEIGATRTDQNFCTHQLRVFVRHRRLGYPTGDPGYELWNNAHTAALEDYGMKEGPHVLYPVGGATTDYEQAVLRAIASGRAPVRWYKIEQRLSVMPVETRGSLPEALSSLGSRGLVRQNEDVADGYELTPEGRELLTSQDA